MADITTRLVGRKLGENMGQSFLVDNRAGATGVIGCELAARAPPDGYTLLMGTTMTHATNPVIFKKLPYDSIGSAKRSALMPDIPTISESGLTGFELGSWSAMFAPAATPPEIVRRVQRAVAVALGNPGMREQLSALGAEPVGSTPEELAAVLKNDVVSGRRLRARQMCNPNSAHSSGARVSVHAGESTRRDTSLTASDRRARVPWRHA